MFHAKKKKLNIAIVIGPFPCTSETFILNHITAMMDLGHNVDVFSFGKTKDEQIIHESVKKYELDKNVTYLFPIPYDRLVRWSRVLKNVVLGVFTHPVWIYRCLKIREFQELCTVDLIILTGYFMKRRYDVIHCHFGPNAQKVSFLKDILKPVKYLVTFHGYDIRRGLEEKKGYYHDLFDRTDHVIAICDYNKIKLQELGCPVSKIQEIPNIIDTQLFSGRNKKDNDIFTIVTVARFVAEKNYEFALKIVRALKESQACAFKYVIVGDGPLKNEVEARVKEYGIADCVEFRGALKQNEVREVLDYSDLFLLSSRNEILPTVVLEAQSMGIPVVATDIGGLRQTIVDGKSGFLIPLDDVEAAKSRIIQIMKNKDLRASLGQEGKRFIAENFDIQKISRRLISVYEN
jgi:colanic acid/amylovoran biosynthesis glycosyltransferase